MKTLILLSLLAFTQVAGAANNNQPTKCMDKAGNILITDEPCATAGPSGMTVVAPVKTSRNASSASTDMAPSMSHASAARKTGKCGLAISAADNPMLKLETDEREIARFLLAPGETRDVSHSASTRQTVMFRVAFNEGMRCKYANGPVAMSTDGKIWVHSYYAGQPLSPVNGRISMMLKNTGQEFMHVLLVTTDR